MSFSSTTDRVSYSGNGATTAFSFPYIFFDQTDLVVIKKNNTTGVETTQTITTHYTISGTQTNGVYVNGGTVTFLTAPASGETVIIYRDRSVTQELDLEENGKIPSESLEKQLDKIAIYIQRVKNKLARTIGLKEGFTASFDPTLPALMTNKGYIRTKSDGSGIEYIAEADLINTISTGSQLFTASRALVSDSNGLATSSATTSTEIGYVGGVTSAIQTQIDSKQTRSVLTTKGDLYAATASDTVTRLPVGANNTVLTADSAQSTGLKYSTISSLTTAPTVQRFTSGSGTYTTPAGVKYIRVTMLGGGGGGGSDATTPANGTAGASTTFGTSLLTAGAGQGGTSGGAGGNGGAPTINSPAITILSQSGAAGGPASGGAAVGGYGGVSFLGHAGPSGGGGASPGLAAGANSGSGGGGAGSASVASGGGGGAGAVIVAQINSPDATYAYSVGTGGSGGSGTYSGGGGGSGVIVVEEFYQ